MPGGRGFRRNVWGGQEAEPADLLESLTLFLVISPGYFAPQGQVAQRVKSKCLGFSQGPIYSKYLLST
jgi:hypothetical protein